MDVVLELFDRFLFDRAYAAVLPASQSALNHHVLSHKLANATYSSMREMPTAEAVAWTYEPSTSFFSLQPTDYAYMSQWPRDNIYRQATSLFLITW
jgi:Delta7-sterol 5-desaturase